MTASRPGSRKNGVLYLILTVVAAAVWMNGDTFLWRDDWLYLLLYRHTTWSLFNGNAASDIKPLFQYLLFPQFYGFGTHFLLYQLLNVGLLALNACLIHAVLERLHVERPLAWAGAFIMLLHPTNFVNANWIFGQCELAHLTLVLAAFLFFFSNADRPGWRNALAYGTALLLQNYFFPDGIFLPLLFILLMLTMTCWDFRMAMISLAVFGVHLVHAFYIQHQVADPSIQTAGLFANPIEKITFLFVLLGNSCWRMIIPNFDIAHPFIVNVLPLAMLTGAAVIVFRKSRHSVLFLSGFAGLLFSSVLLMLTRYRLSVVPYYYTSLHLPYFIMLLAAFGGCVSQGRLASRAVTICWLAIGVGMILPAFRGKKIFAVRNQANRGRMEFALDHNADYQPVDDPAIAIEQYISLDHTSSNRTAVILYRTLASSTAKRTAP
jgi:hypothetical protein